MRSALWAEWIIARFTDRSRAAAIVGDLLETATQQGILWFWLSAASIVLSFIWRRAIAFVAALYLGLHAMGWLQMRIVGIHAVPFGTLLWIAAPYAAIRYGLRDKFAQLALGFCGLITIYVSYWRIPVVTVVCIALALSILVASVRSAQRRRALVALTAALVFGFGGGLLSMYLEAIWQNHFYTGGIDQTNSPLLSSFPLLAVWITTTACARTHDRLFRRDQQGT